MRKDNAISLKNVKNKYWNEKYYKLDLYNLYI